MWAVLAYKLLFCQCSSSTFLRRTGHCQRLEWGMTVEGGIKSQRWTAWQEGAASWVKDEDQAAWERGGRPETGGGWLDLERAPQSLCGWIPNLSPSVTNRGWHHRPSAHLPPSLDKYHSLAVTVPKGLVQVVTAQGPGLGPPGERWALPHPT